MRVIEENLWLNYDHQNNITILLYIYAAKS